MATKEPVAQGWEQHPDYPMMLAYRALRGCKYEDVQSRDELLRTLLSGKNSAWAYFALRNIPDIPDRIRHELCRIIIRGGEFFTMFWACTLSNTPAQSKQDLKEALIKLGTPFMACFVLERLPGLTAHEQAVLTKLSLGQVIDA